MESEVISGQGKTECNVKAHFAGIFMLQIQLRRFNLKKKIIIEQIQGKEGKTRWYATNKINKAKQITKTTEKI